MKKNIKVEIRTSDIKSVTNYRAIFLEKEQIIKYKEKDNTNVSLDIKNDILKRDNDEIYMEYIFNRGMITDGKVLIKEYNKEIVLGIETNLLFKEKNKYELEYKLLDNNDSFYYKLEMED